MSCESLGLVADFAKCFPLHFLSKQVRKIPAFHLFRNAFERVVFKKISRYLVCLFFS